jgi:hypothetical protein
MDGMEREQRHQDVDGAADANDQSQYLGSPLSSTIARWRMDTSRLSGEEVLQQGDVHSRRGDSHPTLIEPTWQLLGVRIP